MARKGPQVRRSESVDGDDTIEVKREASVDGNLAKEMDSAHVTTIKKAESASAASTPSASSAKQKHSRSPSASSLSRSKSQLDQPDLKAKVEELNGHVSPTKSGTPKTKMGRAASAKGPPPRIAPLFDHLPDVTSEATSSFQVIESSTYQNKYLGFTESALECDCTEEWGQS